jgi:hypothetical protein
MKIDMSRDAVTLRLNQVAELRRICLSLAGSSKGLEIQRNKPAAGAKLIRWSKIDHRRLREQRRRAHLPVQLLV